MSGFDKNDPWAWSREELAAYTALETSKNVPLEIVGKNLKNAGISKHDSDSIIQSVVDKKND